MDLILLSPNTFYRRGKRSWINFKLSCRDVLLVCPWQMWKGDEMGKGESNIPSLQVCWGKEHCKDLTSGNHLSIAGKRTAGNFLALGEDEKTKTMCHTHTHSYTHTLSLQWYNDYYTYSPPHFPPPSLMIFRYTPLHGQKHAVTWLVKAAVYVHFSNKPQGWC